MRKNDKEGIKWLKKFDSVEALFENLGYELFFIPIQFHKKDMKRCKKRNYDFTLLKKVLGHGQRNCKLPNTFKPHKLTGNYKGRWECHVKPDRLLFWKQDDSSKRIYLEHTGTHIDLFK